MPTAETTPNIETMLSRFKSQWNEQAQAATNKDDRGHYCSMLMAIAYLEKELARKRPPRPVR